VVPVASDHVAFERAARADGHGQNLTWLGNRLERDVFAESDVTISDGFHALLALAANTERRNSQAYLYGLCHARSRNTSMILRP